MTTTVGTSGRVARRLMHQGWIGAWEIALLVLLALALAVGGMVSPHFLTTENFAITAAGAAGVALMVVPMTWLMIAGEIDLSVASIFGLAGVVFGLVIQGGAPLPLAMGAAIAVGAGAGLLNAFFAVTLELPSLIVTVGTLSVFRGLAFALLESSSISQFPPEFTSVTQGTFLGTFVPNTFVVFLVVAIVAGILLARGTVGRKTYALGSSPEVSRFSGIRVKRVKVALFVASGMVAALAGTLYSGYVSSARANNGMGLELSVIAIVLIGGVSMFGGTGRYLGVIVSLALVTTISSLMTLKFIQTDIQYMVIGLLMSGAVVVPGIVNGVMEWRRSHRT